MLDLLVNSLRQRPDRILVGEIRRQREAETLFEAIHTGHSVYATFHANTAEEAIKRLTNPPINVPKTMLPSLSMLVVQHRNRRTGVRRTFEIAEILPDATPNILQKLDLKRDVLHSHARSKTLTRTLTTFTGMTPGEMKRDMSDKVKVLKWLVKRQYRTVDDVGKCMAMYYTDHDRFMKIVRSGKGLQ